MMIFLRIIVALCGAVLGAILGALTIVAVVKGRIVRRIGSEYGDEFTEDEKKSLAAVECSAKRAYKRTYKARTFRKILGLKAKKRNAGDEKKFSFFTIIKETAEVFNPDSQRPFLELTGSEVFSFGHTLTDKLAEIFDASGLTFLNTFTAATAMDYIRFLSGILKHGFVKKTTGAYGIIMRVINVVNPFFWLKMIVRTVATQRILDEVVYAAVSVTVSEFALLYKKTSSSSETSDADRLPVAKNGDIA